MPAQVALNWVVTQPGVTSTLIGATTLAQLDANLAALTFTIPTELRQRLDEVSSLESVHPYMFFGPPRQTILSGGISVRPWAPAYISGGPVAGDVKDRSTDK